MPFWASDQSQTLPPQADTRIYFAPNEASNYGTGLLPFLAGHISPSIFRPSFFFFTFTTLDRRYPRSVSIARPPSSMSLFPSGLAPLPLPMGGVPSGFHQGRMELRIALEVPRAGWRGSERVRHHHPRLDERSSTVQRAPLPPPAPGVLSLEWKPAAENLLAGTWIG
jgi:hypothetical protein